MVSVEQVVVDARNDSDSQQQDGNRKGGGRRRRRRRGGKGNQPAGADGQAAKSQQGRRSDQGQRGGRPNGDGSRGGPNRERNPSKERRPENKKREPHERPEPPEAPFVHVTKRYGLAMYDTFAAAKADIAALTLKASEVDQLNIVIRAEGNMEDPDLTAIPKTKVFAGTAWALIHDRRVQDGWYNEPR